jgi:hypothetical protein
MGKSPTIYGKFRNGNRDAICGRIFSNSMGALMNCRFEFTNNSLQFDEFYHMPVYPTAGGSFIGLEAVQQGLPARCALTGRF